jgi:uncharacterized protein YkwD
VRNGRETVRAAAMIAALSIALGVAACRTSEPLPPVTPISVDAGRAAAVISAYRSERGLGRVTVDSRLIAAAANYARVMGERQRVNHRIGGSLAKRVTAAGYDWGTTAENLASGQPDLGSALNGWKRSQAHRQNLLNPAVTEIGIGAVSAGSRNYWALILAAPRPQRSAAGPFAMSPGQ